MCIRDSWWVASGARTTRSGPRTTGSSRRPRPWRTAPGAATCSSPRRASSTSTTTASRPPSPPPATSTPGGSGPAPPRPTSSRDLLLPGARDVDAEAFPTTWTQGDLTLPLTYTFSPGEPDDGITVVVPVSVLARLRPDGVDWLVPGLLGELCVATIKALPKRTRVRLVPAPDTAAQVLAALPPWSEVQGGDGPSFREAFAAAARRLKDVEIPLEEFEEEALPPHLRVTFRAINDKGVTLASSRNLLSLQRTLAAQVRDAVRQVAVSYTHLTL